MPQRLKNEASPTYLVAQPFLKWAGGKRALLSEISKRIPAYSGSFFEPFLGAGALFFATPDSVKRYINDANSELIETYQVIRDNVDELIEQLRHHVNDRDHFYEVRSWDKQPGFARRSPVERAARFIYLNKTCFNGLYRVNSSGHFNVPFGDYKKPDFIAEENLRAVSNLLSDRSLVSISNGDYRALTSKALADDFVYFDPPYDPLSPTASFVGYQRGGFSREHQIALRDEAVRLVSSGVHVLLSNSDTPFIREIYSDKRFFNIDSVQVARAISANKLSRGKVGELLIRGNHGKGS